LRVAFVVDGRFVAVLRAGAFRAVVVATLFLFAPTAALLVGVFFVADGRLVTADLAALRAGAFRPVVFATLFLVARTLALRAGCCFFFDDRLGTAPRALLGRLASE